MQSIEGKVAWVTGAGTGIGRAGAVALAGAGAKVILSGRRVPQLDDVAARIADAGGVAEVEPLDIADVEAVGVVASGIIERHGRMDILVNSAGLNTPNRHWRDITDGSWSTIIDVNLNGAFNVSHAAVNVMRVQRDGLIINVSSMASQRVGGVSGIAYTAAKTALNTMNESINHENCHLGIRACALCPGEVATEILKLRPEPPSAEEQARMVQEKTSARRSYSLPDAAARLPKRDPHNADMEPQLYRGVGPCIPRDD